MIERFTVDKLADAIEGQIKGARPEPKLLRRFFRTGKCDGKRGRDSQPIRFYLTQGVSIASSRIAEEYVAVRAEKTKTLEQIKTRLNYHKGTPSLNASVSAPSQQADDQTSASSTLPEAEPDASTGKPIWAEDQVLARDQDLGNALGALAKTRADAAAAQKAAENEQGRVDAGSLMEQKAVIESAHSVGRFLWARYCNGFVHGRVRRRKETSVDVSVDTPDPEITFAIPPILNAIVTVTSV